MRRPQKPHDWGRNEQKPVVVSCMQDFSSFANDMQRKRENECCHQKNSSTEVVHTKSSLQQPMGGSLPLFYPFSPVVVISLQAFFACKRLACYPRTKKQQNACMIKYLLEPIMKKSGKKKKSLWYVCAGVIVLRAQSQSSASRHPRPHSVLVVTSLESPRPGARRACVSSTHRSC